jgi:hypothetical protein
MYRREISLLSHGLLECCPCFAKTIEPRQAEAKSIADERVIGSEMPCPPKVFERFNRAPLLFVPVRAKIQQEGRLKAIG